jgi:hypothetical protein
MPPGSLLKHPDPGLKPRFTVREAIKIVYGRDIHLCSTCMTGALLVIEKWTKDRAPPFYLNPTLKKFFL